MSTPTPFGDALYSPQMGLAMGLLQGAGPSRIKLSGKASRMHSSMGANQLRLARSWMARVRLVNPKVNEKAEPGSNPIEQRAWQDAMSAAMTANGVAMPSGVTHYYQRQGPMPASAPSWAQGKPLKTFRPFINTGGGDVPKGPDMYIDFFGGH